MEDNAKKLKILAQKFIKNMEEFIIQCFQNIEEYSNIKVVLNNLAKDIKINSLVDINYFYNEFHKKINFQKEDYILYLKYANFLFELINSIKIKPQYINKYWVFSNEEEKKVFMNHRSSILDVKTYNVKSLDILKKDIINISKELKSLSPYFDGEKIIQLSKYLYFVNK